MPEESYGFAQTRVRLEEIVTQVRKKDTSLEKSLDLLEEGVRLANQCTELIDHADWEAASMPVASAQPATSSEAPPDGSPSPEGSSADESSDDGGESATA